VGNSVLQVTDGAGAAPENSRHPTRGPSDEPPGQAFPDEPPSVSDQAAHVLVVTAGSALGRRLTLRDELVIGRGVKGEGRLSDDLELSRRHARVAPRAGGQVIIEDLGSANGTFVNGERVGGRQLLKVGDSVRVGSTTLQLTVASRASAPPAAAKPPAVVAERSRAPAAWTADRDVLALGAVFAGCRVQEVISHGEMGVVYRAEELALQRQVALKLIRSEYSRDERFRERFRRESRITAAIDHPNVIPIFDAGDEAGVLYIMMRLVDGTDLRALIAAEGPLEPLRAARIVRQVGAALDAAHARGMLHRDVKPSNVLLARDNHVYLSDFGLAKRAASGERLTRHGTIVAQAEYVAPEQVLNQRIDARADIYALGCLLFETLTGEAPFATWNEGQGPLAHLEAPRPSPLDLRPDLPREFDGVVRRAMAKEPSERYPSAGDLGQAALVAAGGLRRARRWSVVATGEAAPFTEEQSAQAGASAPQAPVPDGPQALGEEQVRQGPQLALADALRWVIALAGLVIVALGMVAALNGISTL
jgi:tRNA A-37 threonylcarbamoyl transferase component Bud32